MNEKRRKSLQQVDAVLRQIIDDWYDRVKSHYVTCEDHQELGVEPEIKAFHNFGNHRIKFARQDEVDVTYGVGVEVREAGMLIVSSVNNKSAGFDYEMFVERLKKYYWRSRTEKPWTEPPIDHFSYGDLLEFEPRMAHSVALEIRKDKADILRLFFRLNLNHQQLLLSRQELLRDLVENYCLFPLQRIYAESYHET